MARILIPVLSVLVLFACSAQRSSSEEASGADAADAVVEWPAGYDDSDCNLDTELEPGKPGSPGNLIQSARNPNGDSELATLMRRFVDDLRDNRVLAEAGEPTRPMFETHRMMRCAWPTVPSERDAAYDQRAISYLSAVRAFDADPSKDRYNAIIGSCVACHQVSCSGVIEFISSLSWR